MKQEVLSLVFETEIATAFDDWTSLQQQLLPITVNEGHIKNMLISLKRGSWSVAEYLRDFKSICDNLATIKKLVLNFDKVFHFSHGLGPRYENFRIVMLSKAPYPYFNEFVLALQGHEQSLSARKEEEKNLLKIPKHFLDSAVEVETSEVEEETSTPVVEVSHQLGIITHKMEAKLPKPTIASNPIISARLRVLTISINHT